MLILCTGASPHRKYDDVGEVPMFRKGVGADLILKPACMIEMVKVLGVCLTHSVCDDLWDG